MRAESGCLAQCDGLVLAAGWAEPVLSPLSCGVVKARPKKKALASPRDRAPAARRKGADPLSYQSGFFRLTERAICAPAVVARLPGHSVGSSYEADYRSHQRGLVEL